MEKIQIKLTKFFKEKLNKNLVSTLKKDTLIISLDGIDNADVLRLKSITEGLSFKKTKENIKISKKTFDNKESKM